MRVLAQFAHWVGHRLIALVAIVVILLVGNAFHHEIREFRNVATDLGQLRQGREALAGFLNQEFEAAQGRVEGLSRSVESELQSHIARLDAEIRRLERDGPEITPLDLITGRAPEKARNKVKVEVLRKERHYLQGLLDFQVNTRGLAAANAELERRRQVHVTEYARLRTNQVEHEALKWERPRTWWLWGTEANKRSRQLEAEHTALWQRNLQAHQDYLRQQEVVKRLPEARLPAKFSISKREVDAVLSPIGEGISSLEQKLQANWINKLSDPVKEVLPTALAILAGIVLGPLVIKLFLYYVVAPIASRRPAVQLLPEASGDIAVGGRERSEFREGAVAAVSQAVSIGQGEEMLIHPEYLQSTSDAGSTRTKWLLDWSLPLSSLASGMVALTRIRSNSDQSFVVSATRDPFSEVGLISVPPLGAVVLQPRNLVGVIQSLESPLGITRHWRLGSLNGWLTLQLRFLVFHGPATLIVKGCRGIRVERAATGRSINQAATIGFSANLAYSVQRYETFMPYFLGKQDLFNDHFAGGPGFCIYEETPHFGKASGVTGRGLEGILDSALKVFGI